MNTQCWITGHVTRLQARLQLQSHARVVDCTREQACEIARKPSLRVVVGRWDQMSAERPFTVPVCVKVVWNFVSRLLIALIVQAIKDWLKS